MAKRRCYDCEPHVTFKTMTQLYEHRMEQHPEMAAKLRHPKPGLPAADILRAISLRQKAVTRGPKFGELLAVVGMTKKGLYDRIVRLSRANLIEGNGHEGYTLTTAGYARIYNAQPKNEGK